MRKFTFSKTTQWGETFTAVEFDSFDEAIKAVEKGVYDRGLLMAPKEAVGLAGENKLNNPKKDEPQGRPKT